jgi:zinc transport system substrate-binding protein
MKHSRSACLLAIAASLCAGVASVRAEALRVVTSIPVLACFAMNVGGPRVEVSCVLPPSVSPHDFALTPGDLKRIGRADVLITQGLGLDDWIERPLSRGGLVSRARHVRASEGIDVVASAEPLNPGAAGHDHAGHDHAGHSHGAGPNPHTWLDPLRAIRSVEGIRDAFIASDPSGKEDYQRMASAYIERLRALEREIRSATKGVRKRDLVSAHDAFPYFADRFGFRVAGVFELFPGREPTPKEVRALRQVVERAQVGALLAEPGSSPRLLEAMAADVGLPVVVLDPLDMGVPGAGFYEDGMRANLKALLAVLNAH